MNSNSMPVFNIETAGPFRSTGNDFELSGWVCGTDSPPAVRVRVTGQLVSAESCLPRPDVKATHSDLSWSQQSGFVAHLTGTAGTHKFRMEVMVDQGWFCFYEGEVTFCSEDLMCHLDSPVTATVQAGEVQLSGWCLSASSPISRLQIQSNRKRFDTNYGLERKDVGQVHPQVTASALSGFDAVIALAPGRYRLSLVARLADGRVVESGHVRTLVVLSDSQSWIGKAASSLLLPFKFAAFSYSRARQWYRYNQRTPRVHEFGRLTKRAISDFQQTTMVSRHAHYRLPAQGLPYDTWIGHNRLSQAQVLQIQQMLRQQRGSLGTISIVMPVYKPPQGYFEAAIASIENQISDRWELCIADDASTQPWVWPALEHLAAKQARIKVTRRATNGNISLATNAAAELACGDYLLFVDQDDLLSPDAVACLALAIVNEGQPDLLYSDDDKVSTEAGRYAPQFKPDWSPELLLHVPKPRAVCKNDVVS
jgi:hypothetical protein